MTDSSINKLVPGVLVIADISGYTRFSRLHYTSLLHAEQIISELLDSIIQTAVFPLQVGQLEGDAVLMVVATPAGKESDVARDVLLQVEQFFTAFNILERSLIACDAGCVCQACSEIGELRLKTVVHFGSFASRSFQGVNELVGADIALMRRLLKSPLREREHILLTEQFFALSGGFADSMFHEVRELPSPLEDGFISVHVYLPRININSMLAAKGSGPALSKRLNQHSFGRMLLNRTRAKYNNLPDGEMNLILYLLEGTYSGFNLLHKAFSRLLRRKSIQILIKPVVLMLVEVKPVNEADQIWADKLLKDALNMARPPLILNKLEGNAVFLYALAENDNYILAENLLRQAERMYSAFEDQCRNSNHELKLCFRAVLHFGDVAIKRVLDFDELAGVPVILIHRILQTSNPTLSAVWMTEEFSRFAAGYSSSRSASVISVDGLGDQNLQMIPFS